MYPNYASKNDNREIFFREAAILVTISKNFYCCSFALEELYYLAITGPSCHGAVSQANAVPKYFRYHISCYLRVRRS